MDTSDKKKENSDYDPFDPFSNQRKEVFLSRDIRKTKARTVSYQPTTKNRQAKAKRKTSSFRSWVQNHINHADCKYDKKTIFIYISVILASLTSSILLYSCIITPWQTKKNEQKREESAVDLFQEVVQLKVAASEGLNPEDLNNRFLELEYQLQTAIAHSEIVSEEHVTYVRALASLYLFNSDVQNAIELYEEEADSAESLDDSFRVRYLLLVLSIYEEYNYNNEYLSCLEQLLEYPAEASLSVDESESWKTIREGILSSYQEVKHARG